MGGIQTVKAQHFELNALALAKRYSGQIAEGFKSGAGEQCQRGRKLPQPVELVADHLGWCLPSSEW